MPELETKYVQQTDFDFN